MADPSASASSEDTSRLPKPAHGLRWLICSLLLAATILNYLDRLTLSILKPSLQDRYGWSEEGYANVAIAFQITYGIGYVLFGRFVDRVGARVGFAVAMALWTVGHLAQTLVTTTRGLAIVRLPLALGESGAFPSGLAAVSEWFPKRERALAIGIFNAGGHAGAIVAPLLVPVLAVSLGWRGAFWVTGIFNIVWLAVWLLLYRKPRNHRLITREEAEYIESDLPASSREPIPFLAMFRLRQTWAYLAGRFLLDPIWWLFIFWLPDFFSRKFDVALKDFGPPIIMVYIMADIGAVGAGWASSRMIAGGYTTNRARKLVMLGCAVFALPMALAEYAPTMWTAVLLLGLAAFATQGCSTIQFAMPSDLFPKRAQGTIVGLGGFAGALGGVLMARFAGWVLGSTGSYTPMFLYATAAFPVALLTMHLINRRYAPVRIASD